MLTCISDALQVLFFHFRKTCEDEEKQDINQFIISSGWTTVMANWNRSGLIFTLCYGLKMTGVLKTNLRSHNISAKSQKAQS